MGGGGVLGALGSGLVAGIVGTVALTISEKIEQAVTHRESSTVPAQVGAKLTGPPLKSGRDVERLGWGVHWAHGITMGLVRGLLGLTGLSAIAASVVHYVLVWSGDVLLYKGLGVAEMPWKWGSRPLATDLFHKLVLSAVTSLVFVALY